MLYRDSCCFATQGSRNGSSNRVAQEFSSTNGSSAKPDNPEDYWTPQGQDTGGEFIERLGAISPVPEHDGTECLKWDDSLWSHSDHFRVSLACPKLLEVALYCTAVKPKTKHPSPLQYRWNVYKGVCNAIETNEGGLEKFSEGELLSLRTDRAVAWPVPA